MRKAVALLLTSVMAFGLTASAAHAEAGFEEFPIFEDEEVGFMNVSAVYFQPVPMAPGQEDTEKYDMHLECDVSAMENNLGYGLGDWVPYLTVDYAVTDADGNVVDDCEGTFMPMSASDGPHYGANIMLATAGTYTLTFTIHSPAENGYLLHTDEETGVPGSFWTEPIVVAFENWEYIPQEW